MRFRAALAGLAIAGGIGAALACDCPVPDIATGPNYFTADMLGQMAPQRAVIRQGLTCPMDNSTDNLTGTAPYQKGFPYFPLTYCQAQDMVAAAASTWTDGSVLHFVPEQRYQVPNNLPPIPQGFPRPRLADGSECFFIYTSYQRAEAAARAEIAWSAGAPAHGLDGYLDITEAAGIPDASVYSNAAWVAGVQSLCTGTYTTTGPNAATYHVAPADTVVLTQGRIADVKTAKQDGIMVDYEPQDGRSEAACTGCGSVNQIAREAQIAHDYGFDFRVYTNPIEPSNGATANNFSFANLPALVQDPIIKRFSITLGPQIFGGATSNGDPDKEFTNQLTAANGGTLPQPGAPILQKLFVNIDLGPAQGGFTPAQMTTIKADLDKWGIPEIDIHAQDTSIGGEVCPAPTRYTLQKMLILLGLQANCSVVVSGGTPVTGTTAQCLESQDLFDLLADLNNCLLSGD